MRNRPHWSAEATIIMSDLGCGCAIKELVFTLQLERAIPAKNSQIPRLEDG